MTPRDAYCTIATWLFDHGFTDIESKYWNYDACLMEAIDRLDICTEQWEQLEEIFNS